MAKADWNGRPLKTCKCGRVNLIDGCAYGEGDFGNGRERHGRKACFTMPADGTAWPIMAEHRIDTPNK